MPAAKIKDKSIFEGISKKLKTITKDSEQFLSAQLGKCEDIKQLLQQTYKATTSSDAVNARVALILPELFIDEMDEEQIWQQLELRNDIVLQQFVADSAKLLALREEKLEVRLNEADSEADEADNDDALDNQAIAADGNKDDELDDDEDFSEGDDDENNDGLGMDAKKPKKLRSSVVDDQFFKLGEMEEFLESEDAKELRKHKRKPADEDDGGIDYFADNFDDEDDDEDDDNNNPNYGDFFQAALQNGVDSSKGKDHFAEENDDEVEEDDNERFHNNDSKLGANELAGTDEDEKVGDEQQNDLDDDDDDDDEQNQKSPKQPASDSDSESSSNDEKDEKPKSSHELRQERLQQRISDYEAEVLGEKPWQLKGEIQATSRPQNSLLEEILEFESTVRPAPVITEETTRRLEDIIRQRIKDQAWDDVQQKVRAVRTPQEYRKQLVLDQEKSKESLAQIYEKEYQRELDKLNPSLGDAAAASEEEPKEHKEVRRLMRALFIKLDALSNFHFIPKPVAPEPKIITNTPAIAMEEVAPVAVSDARLLAPEEIYRGPKHEPMGKSERDRTDKNRERRKKKQKQRAIHKALDAKDVQRQKMGIPLTKKAEQAKLLKTITKHRNVEKITASNDHGALKSSKAFFSKLQDATATGKGGAAAAKAAKKKADAKGLSAKKLKL